MRTVASGPIPGQVEVPTEFETHVVDLELRVRATAMRSLTDPIPSEMVERGNHRGVAPVIAILYIRKARIVLGKAAYARVD